MSNVFERYAAENNITPVQGIPDNGLDVFERYAAEQRNKPTVRKPESGVKTFIDSMRNIANPQTVVNRHGNFPKQESTTPPQDSSMPLEEEVMFDFFGGSSFQPRKQDVEFETRVLEKAARLGGDVAAGVISTVEGGAGFVQNFTGSEGAKALADEAQKWREVLTPEDTTFVDEVFMGTGSMLTFFIPGLGAAKGAGALSKVSVRLARWFGVSVSAATESMVEGGILYRNMLRNGASEEEASHAANWTALVNMPFIAVTNRFGVFGEKGGLVRRKAITALLEGIQEGGQEVISGGFESGLENIKMKDVLRSAGVGAVVGALFGGIAGEGKVRTDTTTTDVVPRPADFEQIDPPRRKPQAPSTEVIDIGSKEVSNRRVRRNGKNYKLTAGKVLPEPITITPENGVLNEGSTLGLRTAEFDAIITEGGIKTEQGKLILQDVLATKAILEGAEDSTVVDTATDRRKVFRRGHTTTARDTVLFRESVEKRRAGRRVGDFKEEVTGVRTEAKKITKEPTVTQPGGPSPFVDNTIEKKINKTFSEGGVDALSALIGEIHNNLIDAKAFAKSGFYDGTYPIPKQGLIAAKHGKKYKTDPKYRASIDNAVKGHTKSSSKC